MLSDSVFAELENNQSDVFYILNEQGQVLESMPVISGVSSFELPFFSYRIESYNSAGHYSFGTWNFVQANSLIENDNYWNWELSIPDNPEKCSCKVYVSQSGINSEIVASSVLAIWIEDIESPSNLYPIVIQKENFDYGSYPHQVNGVLEEYIEIYYPFGDIDNISNIPEITEGSISYYYDSNDEIVSIVNITTHQTKHENGEYYVNFLTNISYLPEGIFHIQLSYELFSRWAVSFYVEIDKTLPIPLILGDTSVLESTDLLIINASESFDPISNWSQEYSETDEKRYLNFYWFIENPDGTVSVPTSEMLNSPSVFVFLPTKAGIYSITLQVTDWAGNTNESIHIITVNNVIPVANMTDVNGQLIDGEYYDYNESNVTELYFSAEESFDSPNEIEELVYGWYLDGVLHSSDNITTIDLTTIGPNVELELIVKDSDGDFDSISIILNQIDVEDSEAGNINVSDSNFLNGLNLVLLTAFICMIILLFVRKKSTEENPLPKWSKHNRQQ